MWVARLSCPRKSEANYLRAGLSRSLAVMKPAGLRPGGWKKPFACYRGKKSHLYDNGERESCGVCERVIAPRVRLIQSTTLPRERLSKYQPRRELWLLCEVNRTLQILHIWLIQLDHIFRLWKPVPKSIRTINLYIVNPFVVSKHTVIYKHPFDWLNAKILDVLWNK